MPSDQSQQQAWLLKALAEAYKGRGFCAPNPAVGAIIVCDNEVLATGYHRGCGTVHAEVDALQQLDMPAPERACLYVTLEPCNHEGKMPPCTQAIIKAGIQHVVYAHADPNSEVAGKGADALREAGINCIHLPSPEIDDFYASYTWWCRTKRPHVTTKLALSLDAKIATAKSKPIALTGSMFQQWTHQQRLQHDIILTTDHTILRDNPQLNVRLKDIKPITKPIMVLDPQAQLLQHPDLAIWHNAAHIVLVHDEQVSVTEKQRQRSTASLSIIGLPVDHGFFPLDAVFSQLGELGFHDVWVEAGAKLHDSLISQHFAHISYFAIAPTRVGQDGLAGLPIGGLPLTQADTMQWCQLGEDMLCTVRWKSAA